MHALKKNKLLALIFLIIIVIMLPVISILVRQRQQKNQHAAGEQTALYFAQTGTQTQLTSLSSVQISPGSPVSFELYLDTKQLSVSGFDITITANPNLSISQITPASDAIQFNVPIFANINTQQNSLRYSRVSTNTSSLITGLLHIATITFTPQSQGTGSINVPLATITSITSATALSVARPSVSYIISSLSGIPPTSSPHPTCIVPPPCLTQPPFCYPPIPVGGWCPPSITPPISIVPPSSIPTLPPGCFHQPICPTCTPGTPCPQIACIIQVICPSGTPNPTTMPTVLPSSSPTPIPSPSPVPTNTPIPIPTETPIPTPTFTPGDTILAFDLLAHGIGASGDNTNPSGGGNPNPVHTSRNITVNISDVNNTPLTAQQGTVTFNSTQGNFTGSIDMGTLQTGRYLVRVKMDGFLTKLVPLIFPVTSRQVNNVPQIALVNGDINNDNQVDLLDYNILVNCYGNKQSTSSCTMPPTSQSPGADLDDDGTVDGIDYNIFVRELSVHYGD